MRRCRPACSIVVDLTGNVSPGGEKIVQVSESMRVVASGWCRKSGELFSREFIKSASLPFQARLEPQGDFVEFR